MIELSLPYINELAKQLAVISTFLGGFSITLLGTLILSDKEGKLLNALIISTAISSLSFIVTVFAMTQMIMVTTEGYPFEINQESLMTARVVGTLMLFVGILTLMVTISLSGWMRSKKMGWITTILGGLTLIVFFVFSSASS